MHLFFCYIKLKNLIFYVVGVRYIQFFFLKQYCFFKESVGFFGFRHFGRRFCALFSYEFESFFETELFFFNESVCFFGFRHFGRRFCALFSYEIMSFFETELFFQ